jgi:hypothetical protein
MGQKAIDNKLADGFLTFDQLLNRLTQEEAEDSGVEASTSSLNATQTSGETTKTKLNEEKTMDLATLKADFPEIYEQVKNEGISEERARIEKIDNCSAVTSKELVKKYKYETVGSAEAMAYEWATSQQTQRQEMLTSIQKDTEKVIPISKNEEERASFRELAKNIQTEKNITYSAAMKEAKVRFPEEAKEYYQSFNKAFGGTK